jgi:hypothetical protein
MKVTDILKRITHKRISSSHSTASFSVDTDLLDDVCMILPSTSTITWKPAGIRRRPHATSVARITEQVFDMSPGIPARNCYARVTKTCSHLWICDGCGSESGGGWMGEAGVKKIVTYILTHE